VALCLSYEEVKNIKLCITCIQFAQKYARLRKPEATTHEDDGAKTESNVLGAQTPHSNVSPASLTTGLQADD